MKLSPTVDDVHKICLEIVNGMSFSTAKERSKIDRFSSIYSKIS